MEMHQVRYMLEFEFGGSLFRREHSHTHLSDLGQMIRPHLETVYQAAANAKRVSNDLTQMKKVPLKLGINEHHLTGRNR